MKQFIKQLVSLQFVFLFCPAYILSLLVFGSDFRGVTGWFYVVALALIFLLHFSRSYWLTLLNRTVCTRVLFLASVVGLIAYRQTHFNVWDEHSISQAILFSVFAVLSYLGSIIAINADSDTTPDAPILLTNILVIFALCWMFAFWYSHILFFLVAIFLGLASIHLSWAPTASPPYSQKLYAENVGWERYVVIVLTLDIALVIWDYKVNSLWASFIAISFMAAAIGALMANVLPRKNKPRVVVVLMLNFLLAIIFPQYILNVLHSFISGLGVGLLLYWSFGKNPQAFYQRTADHWPFVILGLMLSYVFYVHLSLTFWRSTLLIPFLVLGSKVILKRILKNPT